MRSFGDGNPIVTFAYFASVTSVTMFCDNPIIRLLSLVGAAALFIVRRERGRLRFFALMLGVFAAVTLINPLFSHSGDTVLFVMNDNPVTLEAVLYGASMGVSVVATLLWFRSFSRIMTADRLMYLFGSFSPKLALLLSMTLRYVPLFVRQSGKVARAQKAMGLSSGKSGGRVRVFSVMVTWALENGIITADSMAARGYGSGKRTFFSLIGFNSGDAFRLCALVCLTAVTVAAACTGALDYSYYPAIVIPAISADAYEIASYAAYGALALLPTAEEAGERLRWKYLLSGI